MAKLTKHEKIHKKLKRKYGWKLATVILLALCILLYFTGGLRDFGKSTQDIGEKAAVDKAMEYINSEILQPGTTATLEGIVDSDVDSLYKFNIKIAGREYVSYVSRDGRYLIPQEMFDMEEVVETTIPTTTGAATTDCSNTPKKAKPKVSLYYMSYCPYGIQAMQGLAPAIKLLGDSVDFEPHFVIYENYRGGGADYCLDDGKLCSMHGIKELNEDVRQACLWKYEKEKFFDYTLCTMSDCSLSNIETCWKTCADKYDVDVSKTEKCLEEEAVALMTKERELNAKNGVSGSPSIFVNDVRYSGGRAPENFKQGICCGYTSQPSACGENLGTAAGTAAGSC